MNEKHNPWKIIDSESRYDNNWISLTHYNVINPSGGQGIYGKVHFKNLAIGIVPLDKDLNTYLVGQYRFTIDKYSWEIPEGGGPFNEQPLAAAKRELAEETGLHAADWTEILQIHLSNSVSDEFGHIYLARGLSQYAAMPEETEQLAVKKLPLADAIQMIEHGTITDSMSIAGLLKVKLMLLEGRL
ncbi:MAG TPA: NUDIX hydrolase [Chitinophagaceae bacterium]|nr:NUDIX hydrolase [Chitinophagaceae bacterium]